MRFRQTCIPIALLAAAAALAACSAPREAIAPVSDEARAAPPPRLIESARFDTALTTAGPDAERLDAAAGALSARAAALRARAAALSAPVVEDARRERLEAAAP
jgi:hypothetical protein